MRHQTFAIQHLRQSFGIRRSHRQSARRGTATPAVSYRHDRRTATRPFRNNPAHTAPDPITLAAATWLACGIVLLGLTPLPLRDATLGWSPAFWGLAAPLVMLLVRHPHTWLPSLRTEQRRTRR